MMKKHRIRRDIKCLLLMICPTNARDPLEHAAYLFPASNRKAP